MLAIKLIFNHSARKPPYKINYTSLETKIIFHSNWQISEILYVHSNRLKPILFNSLQYFIVVALVFQLQLHERGMKIHEIIYEQVNALLLCTETCLNNTHPGISRPDSCCLKYWLLCFLQRFSIHSCGLAGMQAAVRWLWAGPFCSSADGLGAQPPVPRKVKIKYMAHNTDCMIDWFCDWCIRMM